MPFFHLKSVKNLYIDRLAMGISDDDDVDVDELDEIHLPVNPFALNSSLLLGKQKFQAENLHLDRCVFDGDKLFDFLNCFPFLRHLKYSHGGPAIDFAEFSPLKVSEAIAHLKLCLQSLELCSLSQLCR